MNDHTSFKRIAAITAIVAAALALSSTFIPISAVGFDFELLDEPVRQVTLGADVARQFRWSWILAGFGFYLLLIPVVLYLRMWLNSQRSNLVRMYTAFGLGYCFIGAISLFTMATVLSPMMQAYAEAPAADRDMLVTIFQAIANFAYASLGTLSFILGGTWWLGIGLELRAKYHLLGIVTVVLGIATLGSGLGYLFQIEPLARLEVFNYFLGPVWAAWLGIVIGRGAEKGEQILEAATAV